MRELLRKFLTSTQRCWSTQIYAKIFKGHPPTSFLLGSQIIEAVHTEMMDFLMKTGRPIEVKYTLGTLELRKIAALRNAKKKNINWKKTKERGTWVRELNHHTSGYTWRIRFIFAQKQRLAVYKFLPLRKHNRELARRIFNKEVI